MADRPEPLKPPEDLEALIEKRRELAKALFDDDMPLLSETPDTARIDSIGDKIVQRAIEGVRKKQEYAIEPVEFTFEDMVAAVAESVSAVDTTDELPDVIDLSDDDDVADEPAVDDTVVLTETGTETVADVEYGDIGSSWSSTSSAEPDIEFDYEYGSNEASFDW